MFKDNQGKGFIITFPNGCTASVAFGYGNYCQTNQTSHKNPPYAESSDAEVAAWWETKGLPWAYAPGFDYSGDEVMASMKPLQVLQFLAEIAALEPENPNDPSN